MALITILALSVSFPGKFRSQMSLSAGLAHLPTTSVSDYSQWMRFFLLISVAVLAGAASAESPAGKLWTELKEKRSKLTNLREEIDVSRTFRLSNGKAEPTG